ncbi:dephospho-CoA kinase [Mycoplasmopsis agassizii]|uniref:Dephospho-CoA kinase n=1 Tax=Mycoplasmopsis agassizii TaxID=33922 RepID=A0A269TJ09_9BACT|nr:dephospho-CoA kinase [Mycoplasmopsis agassizii]PAK21473.1 dephospho-CoA kinase [Mycoplasmopsis agassizii]
MKAITGKAFSGKSYFANQLRDLGFKVLVGDEFYKSDYMANQPSYNAIKSQLGSEFVTETEVDRQKLRDWILVDLNNLDKLSKVVHPFFYEHLKSNYYDFVEIADINNKNFNFFELFSNIYVLNVNDQQRQKHIKNRNVNKSQIELFKAINRASSSKNVVNISYEERQNPEFLKQFLKK